MAAFVGAVFAEDLENIAAIEPKRQTKGFRRHVLHRLAQQMVQVERGEARFIAVMAMRFPLPVYMLDVVLRRDMTFIEEELDLSKAKADQLQLLAAKELEF